jgi:hypothetical protein
LDLHLVLNTQAQIIVNGQSTQAVEIQTTVGLTDPLALKILGQDHIQVTKLTVDGYDIPNYHWKQSQGVWTLDIANFYPWLHDVTGQGWIA